MKTWNHSICDPCWLARERGREPVRIQEPYRQISHCCFCGIDHRSGIFVRENPQSERLVCQGKHPDDDE
jgi:hypothetical protein